ncbi:MAG: SctD/MshK family protein, partial [Geminicoccaceae bacterium]
ASTESPETEGESVGGSVIRDSHAMQPRSRMTILWSLIGILGAAALLLLEVIEPSDDGLPTLAIEPEPDEAELLLNVLAPFEADADIQLLTDSNWIVVEGYVGTELIKDEIEGLLAAANPKVESRLFAGNQLVEAASETLSALGSSLTVDYVPHGKLRLNGFVSMNSDLQRIVDTLESDVAGLKEVENAVLTNVDVVGRLRDQLADAGLSRKIGLRMQEDAIIVYGEIGPGDLEAWRSIRRDFDQAYMPFVRLTSRLMLNEGGVEQISPSEQTETVSASSDFVVTGINAGNPPFIIAHDNARYLEGSTIPGNWKIERIELDKIVLSRNGQRHILRP